MKVHTLKGNQLRQRILPLQESVKKRTAEFLHGRVQSKLMALQHSLYMCQELVLLDPEKVAGLLEKISDDLQRVQEDDIRRASDELYPFIVKLGLTPALRSLADRFQPQVSVELYVAKEIESKEQLNRKLIPEEFKVAVYRIAEEALDNVAKHAQVNMAEVSLNYQKDRDICLGITDNGRGFKASGSFLGLGFLTIQDYAEALARIHRRTRMDGVRTAEGGG